MLFQNSYGSLNEHPEYKARQRLFRLQFLLVKIIERLLHGLTKMLLEAFWIEGYQLLIKSADHASIISHRFLEIFFVPAPA